MEQKTWELFLAERRDLPAGAGFGLFTKWHFLALSGCLLLTAWILCRAGKTDPEKRTGFLRRLSLLLLLGNVLRDLFLLAIGRYGIGYLPLHLCSMAVFVFLGIAFLPENGFSRTRRFLGATALPLFLPGALTALLFPDWSDYPLFNLLCLHSFAWHALLLAFPLVLFLFGGVRPRFSDLRAPIAFLLLAVPPVYLFDRAFSVNYLFVLRPVPGTPLETFARSFGGLWRIPYGLTVFCVMAVFQLVFSVLGNALHRQ